MVKKSDWKTVEMPEEREYFQLKIRLDKIEMQLIRKGFLPEQMEDKWFIYFEDNKIYMHRSWTGYCIYIGEFAEDDIINVTVNRNKNQYTNTNTELDRIDFEMHINFLTGRSNRELMLEYMKIHRKGV